MLLTRATLQFSLATAALALPHILLLLADDLGWGDPGYQGGRALTPHLDRMARADGTVRLSRMYVSAPVCSPSRAALLTGRNPNRFCLWGSNTGWNQPDFSRRQQYTLPASEPSLPALLAEAGYRTAVYGKWHLGDFAGAGAAPPDLRGFADWLCTARSVPSFSPNCGCFPSAPCENGHYGSDPPCLNYWTSHGANRTLLPWPFPVPGDDSLFLFRHLKRRLLAARAEGRPLFAFLPLHAVHTRYVAPPWLRRFYLSRGLSAQTADYFGAVTALDRTVGLVRALLRRLRLETDTVLWFLSDNGPSRESPGRTGPLRGRKGELLEGGVRVPGLFEWPRLIRRNREVLDPVAATDILPTLLDLLNRSQPLGRPLDGRSVLPLLSGRQMPPRPLGWAYNVRGNFSGRFQVGWLEQEFKGIFYFNRHSCVRYRLYNLTADPGEAQDLSSQQPQRLSGMLSSATEWLRGVEHSARHEAACLP